MTLNHHSITSEVYSYIRDCNYKNAIQFLQSKLEDGASRLPPILSLLAYCSYHDRDYLRASELYEELLEMSPACEQYQLYYLQSLVNAESYIDASRAATLTTVSSSSPFFHRIKLLHAQAQVETGLLSEATTTLAQCNEEDTNAVLCLAGIHFRKKDYASALDKYTDNFIDERPPSIAYCRALCHYHLEQHEMALRAVTDIIVATAEDPSESESCLVEALNLKAAIQFAMKDLAAARATMKELIQLQEDNDLHDAVTMHNYAIVNFSTHPTMATKELNSLFSQQSYPSEILGNILVMYLGQGHDDLASETFEANRHVLQELLSHETYSYLQAAVGLMTSPNDNVTLENSVAEHAKRLKSEMKRLNTTHTRAATASSRHDSSRPVSCRPSTATYTQVQRDLAHATKEFDTNVKQFVPLLMLQAKVLWDQREFAKTESFLMHYSEILRGNDIFCENLAHALFVQQGDKLEESISYYERLIHSHTDTTNLLELPAMVLANLTIAYILSNQNGKAEAIMKAIEHEEDNVLATGDTAERYYHNCIVNLAVGTLYCEKGNFVFGLSRICKSLEPFDKNLCPDTWFYTKRCFLALASKISKLMFCLSDDMFDEIIDFLEAIENEANSIFLDEHTKDDKINLTNGPPTIASEARQLKKMFITLSE
jgi:tetratricopeptide repeat protein 30